MTHIRHIILTTTTITAVAAAASPDVVDSLFHSSLHSINCRTFCRLPVKWSERWLLRNLHFKVERFSGQFCIRSDGGCCAKFSTANNTVELPKENNINWLQSSPHSFSAQSSGGGRDALFPVTQSQHLFVSLIKILPAAFFYFSPPFNLVCRVRHYSNVWCCWCW